ncbi:MAG TPA: ABC transporter permease [Candidatus Nanoarchaeia archaeon]|nr:ABC transporter permease [Candidatus Nanoarchaeia archaeon]
MQSLWLLTIKNLKLLLRSRSSALIIIFAPLLIILLLGLSYNTSAQFGLKIGVYAADFNEDANSFIEILEEKEFTITKFNDLNTCTNDIKRSQIHTCIELPESLQVDDNQQKVVTFHIDPSRINLVWMIQETVKSKFNIKAQEISQELTGNILSILSETKGVLNSQQIDLSNIKQKTKDASTSASSVKNNLEGVSVGSDGTVIEGISDQLTEANDKISTAISEVNSAGITDDEKRDAIKDPLNEASRIIDDLQGNESISLNGVRDLLEQAAAAITSSTANLDLVTAALQEAATEIESVQSSLAAAQNSIESQKVTEADTITSPLITKIERISQENTYLSYLFPALLVLVVMFSSLLLGTTLVMIEKNSPAFLRNFFLPVRKITFITSIYVTNVILNLVEISVILGISLFFLKSSVAIIPTVALILFVTGSVFTFLGMAIGYIFSSEETGILASISLGSILLFTSGTILPLEGIAEALRKIVAYNPFVIGEKLVREVFIFNASLSMVGFELGILLAYAIVLFLVIWIIESIIHQQMTHKFMRHHHSSKRTRKP